MIIAGHAHPRPNDTVAAVLSLVIPGAGQIYKGRIAMGIAWLVLTVLGYLTLLVPGMLLHFICVFQAFGMEPSIGWER
jgi:TM2 domain-containing membrane protein YozV